MPRAGFLACSSGFRYSISWCRWSEIAEHVVESVCHSAAESVVIWQSDCPHLIQFIKTSTASRYQRCCPYCISILSLSPWQPGVRVNYIQIIDHDHLYHLLSIVTPPCATWALVIHMSEEVPLGGGGCIQCHFGSHLKTSPKKKTKNKKPLHMPLSRYQMPTCFSWFYK